MPMIGQPGTFSNLLKGYGAATPRTYGMISSVAPNPMHPPHTLLAYNKGRRTGETYIQQHPNYPHWGYTVSYTPTDDGRILLITDTECLSVSKEEARIEWRQNARTGWIRLR